MDNKFAKRLLELRTKRKISRREVAKAAHICEKTLRSWEYGKTKPRVRHLVLLVKFFDVKCDYLLGISDKEKDH